MNLQNLLEHPQLASVVLQGLCEHTSEVQPDYGFVGIAEDDEALQAHCEHAVRQGAVALFMDSPEINWSQDIGVPVIQVPHLAKIRGELAAAFYADPSAQLTCVGVTGTNGKTSVAYHVADLGARLGMAMGYCGTLGWGELGELLPSNLTTPNSIALQRQLATLRDQGCAGVALEVSSHALDQGRAQAVGFDYGVFTNLTRDHLDYHGSVKAYGEAKARLFLEWPLQAAVINIEDPFGCRLAARTAAPVITYGQGGDWQWTSRPVKAGREVRWHTPEGAFEAILPVVADFAIANLTAAAATLVAMGYSVDHVIAQLSHLEGVPGRMEVFSAGEHAPQVVVDYAHTPDALSKVLTALQSDAVGKLVCVVGCGGNRDQGKRPEMGRNAATLADVTWFTADNPRHENVETIIAEMRSTLTPEMLADTHVCLDRAEAIRQAIINAEAHDVVLIAGKGHEAFQEIGDRRVPFDDRKIVAHTLREHA